MAAPVPAFVPLVAVVNAAFGGQLVTIADLAPLATHVQPAAATAPLATHVQLAAATAPLATHAQVAAAIAALQVNMDAQFAAIHALLAPLAVPAIAGAATAIVQAVAAARAQNAHDNRGMAYAVVPRSDGTPPPNWPAGFSREDLVDGPIAVIDALLNDYGLPHGAPAALSARRNALARHIGTPRA